eukprot:CAMPEP_0113508316 /NCGR_PEP_ID=MMETSP0014_2-20120614/36951_1 /TAXON_ID=2857 /ORGANISM="Nitzschia sp." /LENGTH=1594 /DNA_ID=CAMNT_0000404019 /DNA_START=682 /DNA_END=5466 /DNA_ORIENTATION=+ /assembly_acc=CAM_ASM_000159
MVAAVGQCLWEEEEDVVVVVDPEHTTTTTTTAITTETFACNREGVRNTTLDWANDIFLTILSCLLTVHAWYNVTPNRHLRATTTGAFATITLTSIFETCQKMKFSNSGTDDGYGLLEYYYFEIFIALTSATAVLLLYQPAWRSWLSIKVDSRGHKTTKCFCGLLWLRLWSTLAVGAGCLLIIIGCGWTIFKDTNVLTLDSNPNPDQSQTEQFVNSVVESFTGNSDSNSSSEVNLLVDDGYPPRSPLPSGSSSIILMRYGQALWTLTTLLFLMVSSVIYIYHAKQPLKGRVYATTPTGLGIAAKRRQRRRRSHSSREGSDDDSVVSRQSSRSSRSGRSRSRSRSQRRPQRVVLPRDYHQRGVFGLTTIWAAVLLLVTQITTMTLYFGLFVVETKIVNGNALLRQPNIQVLQAGFVGFFQVLTVFLLYSCVVSLFPLHVEEDSDEDTTDGSTGPSGSDDDVDQDFAVVRESHVDRRLDIPSSSSSSSSSSSVSSTSSMDDDISGGSYDDNDDDDEDDLEEQSSYDSTRQRRGRPTYHNVNAFMFVMLTHNLNTHSTQNDVGDMSETSSTRAAKALPSSRVEESEGTRTSSSSCSGVSDSDEATNNSHSLSAESKQVSVGATSSSSSSVWKRPFSLRRSRVTRPMTMTSNNQARRQSSTKSLGTKSIGKPPLPPRRTKSHGMSNFEVSIQESRAETEGEEQRVEEVENRDQQKPKRKSLLGGLFGGTDRRNRTRQNQKKMRNRRHRKATSREGTTTTVIRVAEGDTVNSNAMLPGARGDPRLLSGTELNRVRSSQVNLADSASQDGNSIVSVSSSSANEGNVSVGGDSDDTEVFDNRAETIESRRFKTIDNQSVDTPSPSQDDASMSLTSEYDDAITANEYVFSEEQRPDNFGIGTMSREQSAVSASAMIVRNSSLRSSSSKGRGNRVTSRRLTWAATVEDHVRSVTCQPMTLRNANVKQQGGESWDEEFDRANPSILANIETCLMDEVAAMTLPQCDHDTTCVEAIETYLLATGPHQTHQQNNTVQRSFSNASGDRWETLIAIPIDNTACASEPETTATKTTNERSGNLVTKMGAIMLSRFGGGRKNQQRSVQSETSGSSIVEKADSDDASNDTSVDDDDQRLGQEGDIRTALSNLSTSAQATGNLVSTKSLEIVNDTGNMMVEMYNDPCPGVENPLTSSPKPRKQQPMNDDDISATAAAADDASQMSIGEALAKHLSGFLSSGNSIDNASRGALLSASSSSLDDTETSRLESIDRTAKDGDNDEAEDDETSGNSVDVLLEKASSASSASDPTIEIDQEQDDDVSSMGGDTASLVGGKKKSTIASSIDPPVVHNIGEQTKQQSTSNLPSSRPPRPTRKSKSLSDVQRHVITPNRSSSSTSSRSENQPINPKEPSSSGASIEDPIAQTRSISAISLESTIFEQRLPPVINNDDSEKQMREQSQPESADSESKPWIAAAASLGQTAFATVVSDATTAVTTPTPKPRKSLEANGLKLDFDTDDDVPVADSRNDVDVDMKGSRGSYRHPVYDRSCLNVVKSNSVRAVLENERTVSSTKIHHYDERDGQSMSPSRLVRQPSPSLQYAPKVSDMRMLFERNQ